MISELNSHELETAAGGFVPLAALGTLVTSKTFTTFATTITLIGFAADIGTELISDE